MNAYTFRGDPDAYRAELIELLGERQVILPGKKVSRYLRDFSWYSPVLDNALSDTTVEVVALPHSVEELTAIVALAARHRATLTMRGAGTGNYGQSLPLEPGIVVDIRGVKGVLEIEAGRVVVLPGTVMRDIENAAQEIGYELAVMPSTFRVATASGFISGGSGGLGASANGDLWNKNILAVELLTVEEEPRLIRLEGPGVLSVLHMYGTVGVITKIEMRLVPAHAYNEYIVTFSDYEDAARFGWEAVASQDVHTRLISVHQAPLGASMTPIADAFGADEHIALAWVASDDDAAFRELVTRFRGTPILWPADSKDVTQFVYSHSILWSRRAHPESSWLQCEYAAHDQEAFIAQMHAIEAEYGGVFLQHIELVRSPTGGVRAVGIPALVGLPNHEEALDGLIAFCKGLDMIVLNPHSFVVEEGGMVGGVDDVIALKRESDPYGILNPGKLGSRFFDERTIVANVTEQIVVAPEQMPV
jgi:hypothetical protein